MKGRALVPLAKAQVAETCHICDQAAAGALAVDGARVPMCQRCVDRGLTLKLTGAFVSIVDSETGEIVGRFPVEYSDHHVGSVDTNDWDALAGWLDAASLSALRSVWDISKASQQYLQAVQFRIAYVISERFGFYGGGWAQEAAKVLQKTDDMVRNYATIWRRLGQEIEGDFRLLNLGFSLLLRAASSPEPAKALAQFAAQQDAGLSRMQIEAAHAATQCDHVWAEICVKCGARKEAD